MKALKKMLNEIQIEVNQTRDLIGKGSLDNRVMTAMGQVLRHNFLPETLQDLAYENGPKPIGSGQTISQPYMVALMSDLLNTKATDRVLEVGTGSGYQAAILAKLVSEVYTIEILENLANTARARLNLLGYKNVVVRTGDGYFGWPEHAPYDGIIVTAAAPEIPTPLIEQLRIGARLVIPIGLPHNYQELMVLEKWADDEIKTKAILGVSFVPLTGNHKKRNQVKYLIKP